MERVRSLAVKFQNEKLVDAGTGDLVPDELGIGRKGRLLLSFEGNVPVFTCFNGAGELVYTLKLTQPGEYYLDADEGKYCPSEDELHRWRYMAGQARADEISARKITAQRATDGRRHHAELIRLNSPDLVVVSHGQPYEITLDSRYAWCRTDGTANLAECGDGKTVITVTEATWAVFSSSYIVVWKTREGHIYPSEAMFEAIGEALELEEQDA